LRLLAVHRELLRRALARRDHPAAARFENLDRLLRELTPAEEAEHQALRTRRHAALAEARAEGRLKWLHRYDGLV
jgi:hypothetical protein